MSQGIQVEVWGDYALFTRPELKTERFSYEVPTPSAARGIVDAIFRHPGLRWHIDRIHVMNPIVFTSIRRNEVEKVISHEKAFSAMCGKKVSQLFLNSRDTKIRVQRASIVLTRVRYVIDAHFTMTSKAAPSDNEGKFIDIARRRLTRGQCYYQPYLGCREFPAHFRAWPGGPVPAIPESRSLGLMLYDMDYSDQENIQPMFFLAELTNGVLEVAGKEVLR